MGKLHVHTALFLLAAAFRAVAGYTAEDALNSDGSLKEEFEYVHGKYFLKEGHSLITALDAESAFYYTQSLDHFDNNNNATWEQVGIITATFLRQ